MSAVAIGYDTQGRGFAQLHVYTTEEVAAILLGAGLVTPGALRVSGTNVPTRYVVAPGECWDNVADGVREATRILEEQRQSALRKRLLAAAEAIT